MLSSIKLKTSFKTFKTIYYNLSYKRGYKLYNSWYLILKITNIRFKKIL